MRTETGAVAHRSRSRELHPGECRTAPSGARTASSVLLSGHAPPRRRACRTPPAAPAAAPGRRTTRTRPGSRPPICTSATWVNPASTKGRTASTCAATSGPQGIASATSSGRTNCVAAANPAVPGSSALTFHPPANQRNWSCAVATAASRSGPQESGCCPIFGSCTPAASSNPCTSAGSGSTATIASAIGANVSTDWLPDTATAIGTRPAGQVPQLRASRRGSAARSC